MFAHQSARGARSVLKPRAVPATLYSWPRVMSELAQRPPSAIQRAYRFVNRPYYWFRPAQLALRLRAKDQPGGELRLVRTAWGAHLYCWPDPLGQAVARTGVYDLTVAETLARLAAPGESAIDAGANVGLMSSLLARSVGPQGHVTSFEPHPMIFATLARNVALWEREESVSTIEARQAAVSATAGTLPLAVDPQAFAHNKGTASLEHVDGADVTDVQTVRLDEEISGPVGVLKLDVEMHELAALEGAEALLSSRLIRDIVFEEHEPPPTPVTQLLEAHGYEVLSVRQGLTGPILCAPAEAHSKKLWDPPALLATSDPSRARGRLGRRGWVSLRSRPRNGAR
jgi:FkbM family methyltransferase